MMIPPLVSTQMTQSVTHIITNIGKFYTMPFSHMMTHTVIYTTQGTYRTIVTAPTSDIKHRHKSCSISSHQQVIRMVSSQCPHILLIKSSHPESPYYLAHMTITHTNTYLRGTPSQSAHNNRHRHVH